MPKIDITLSEVLTPEQLIHVKAKVKEVVKTNLTGMGRLTYMLGCQYYVLGYNKAGGHIDVYTTIKTRTWHPVVILIIMCQIIWEILVSVWDNLTYLGTLFTPKVFSYNVKITSFIVRNNLKKK